MTLWTIIRRSLRFHARSHLGVVLGAAVGSAALIGALVVGDSVRQSLRERALARLGNYRLALESGDRFFRAELASPPKTPHPLGDAALILAGTAANQNGEARANRVNVLGVDQWFLPAEIATNAVVLNEALAQQLQARVNDTILLRVRKPTALSGDAVITPREDSSVALRLKVSRVVSSTDLGDFSLRVSQLPPLNAFVNLQDLAARAGLPGRANLLLNSATGTGWRRSDLAGLADRVPDDWQGIIPGSNIQDDEIAVTRYNEDLERYWQLADAQLELHELPAFGQIELRTSRIFLDPPVVRAALAVETNAAGILTYLVNQLRADTNAAPYSMVTAAGAPWTPPDLREDEIIVNQWLADDLGLQPGGVLDLTYFLPESGTQLIERTNRFHVRSVVPMTAPYADRTLMPEFPGVAKAESTHDWDAGFPLVHKIRDQDEQYWKEHRGTPKAFVSLAAGQKMWGSRFGNLTALRFPIPPGRNPTEVHSLIESNLLTQLSPNELGLRFEPVRKRALAAANQAQDFGGLFLGFSFFVIVAALILMALLFQFGLEQRAVEVGTLFAVGLPRRMIGKILFREGAMLAFLGGVLGVAGGLGYAWAMMRALTTVWRDAVAGSALSFHATLGTVALGLAASIVICAVTIWFVLRRMARRPARELLAGVEAEILPGVSRASSAGEAKGEDGGAPARAARSTSVYVAWTTGLIALGLVGWAIAQGDESSAGIFFGAGALLLAAGLASVSTLLRRLERTEAARRLTIGALGLRGCVRRRKRSLATAALLACGSFLIVAIGAFRLEENAGAWKRTSGTGGFALIGETALPVLADLNTREGRDALGLEDTAMTGVSVVPLRVREGDDASCLNLNRAQTPRLLGVKPELLASRGAFTFAKLLPELPTTNGWMTLQMAERSTSDDTAVPAIGDAASIQWALGKKIGETIDYTDERGRKFKVLLVGAVANSILQGNLLIGEAQFVRRFPSESGYRMFLIDAPSNAVSQVSARLSRALQDVGLELTPASRRLAQYNAVQNTYLGTFQVLGGLGLLIGSAGLGVVVLRNVLERRSELALLQAVGFRKGALRRLVLSEHVALLGLGLLVGLVAAVVAVLPALWSSTAALPVRSLTFTLAGVLGSGLVWTILATAVALRGRLLEALRGE